jgi:hypothetical protein
MKKLKCPFCFGERQKFVKYNSDDCLRMCVECTNCGLRAPGAEYDLDDPDMKDLATEFWNDLSKPMSKFWNPDDGS